MSAPAQPLPLMPTTPGMSGLGDGLGKGPGLGDPEGLGTGLGKAGGLGTGLASGASSGDAPGNGLADGLGEGDGLVVGLGDGGSGGQSSVWTTTLAVLFLSTGAMYVKRSPGARRECGCQ